MVQTGIMASTDAVPRLLSSEQASQLKTHHLGEFFLWETKGGVSHLTNGLDDK